MSKSLVKLLDYSIVPASVMIVSKFAGVVLTIKIFNIPWTVKDYANSILSFATFLRKEDVTLVTSYSDLIMFLALAVFFSFNIIRAVYLHNTHLKPNLIMELAKRNMLNLITGSFEIYHSCLVWLAFTWIANILLIVNLFSDRTFIWIGVVTTIINLVLTSIFAQDVYREIDNIKRNPQEYTWK